MHKLRFAVIGTGFWANYQIPAWMELEGAELVALYNRTISKAEILAGRFGVSNVYENIDRLLENEKLDFVDIITDVDTHAAFTAAAAKKGIAVICQKPMAPSLSQARLMLELCESHRAPLFIHENWRWQAPIRKIKSILDEDKIGRIYKARISFCSGFPVFENQPFLADLEEFILTDIGSHILDVCRFLFGEVYSLLCHIATVNQGIKGEDMANVMMKTKSGVSCFAEMSYATILPQESFPQTLMQIEGEKGSVLLELGHKIVVSTRENTEVFYANPPSYPWVDPAYALVHSSIVDCNRDILKALRNEGGGETSGKDNFQTVRLVHAAYASARTGTVVIMDEF